MCRFAVYLYHLSPFRLYLLRSYKVNASKNKQDTPSEYRYMKSPPETDFTGRIRTRHSTTLFSRKKGGGGKSLHGVDLDKSVIGFVHRFSTGEMDQVGGQFIPLDQCESSEV